MSATESLDLTWPNSAEVLLLILRGLGFSLVSFAPEAPWEVLVWWPQRCAL